MKSKIICIDTAGHKFLTLNKEYVMYESKGTKGLSAWSGPDGNNYLSDEKMWLVVDDFGMASYYDKNLFTTTQQIRDDKINKIL